MEQLSGAALLASRKRKRQLAAYAWLACNSREDEGPDLPRELVHKIARYVHDEKDDEMVVRTYNLIDKCTMKVYDESMDMFREYEPADSPYYVIQRAVYTYTEVFKFGQDGRLISSGHITTKLVTHTVRLLSEAEFARLRANGVFMMRGAAVNTKTGEIIKAEEYHWEPRP